MLSNTDMKIYAGIWLKVCYDNNKKINKPNLVVISKVSWPPLGLSGCLVRQTKHTNDVHYLKPICPGLLYCWVY